MNEGSTVAADLGALPIERTPLASTYKGFPHVRSTPQAHGSIVGLGNGGLVERDRPRRAEEILFFRSVGDLTITEGALPMGAEGRFAQRDSGIGFTGDWQLRTARQPYASLDGPGEIYLDTDPKRGGTGDQQRPGTDLT